MKKDKQKSAVHLGAGTASIMTIFVVLCFTVFATLYFLQARSYGQRVERYNDSVEQYFMADAAASKEFIQIVKLAEKSSDISMLIDEFKDTDYLIEDNILRYEVIIDDNSYLLVECIIKQEEIITVDIVTWKQVTKSAEGYGMQSFDF